MNFNNEDDLRQYFKEHDSVELLQEFNVQGEVYRLEIIVTGYSRIYTQLNGNGEWIVMRSGKVFKVG